MRVLTLKRPWPWAIFALPVERAKDVENRKWSAPASALSAPVAIHAGAGVDRDKVRDGRGKLLAASPADFIEKVCGERPPEDGGEQGIVGVVRFGAMMTAAASPWFMGPVGWAITERAAVTAPVAHVGRLGLRELAPDVEAAVVAALLWPEALRGGILPAGGAR